MSAAAVSVAIDQTRGAAKRAAEAWKDGARVVSDQWDRWVWWQPTDVVSVVARSFGLLDRGLQISRAYAIDTAGLLSALGDLVRDSRGLLQQAARDQAAIDGAAER
jgi:hypothetical protein